jgi:hypothetical protein
VKSFAVAVVEVFRPEFFRASNAQDTARLLKKNLACGFPSILTSIYFMHWRWKSCHATWDGQFGGSMKDFTIIFKTVADHETWIGHECLVLAMTSIFPNGQLFLPS